MGCVKSKEKDGQVSKNFSVAYDSTLEKAKSELPSAYAAALHETPMSEELKKLAENAKSVTFDVCPEVEPPTEKLEEISALEKFRDPKHHLFAPDALFPEAKSLKLLDIWHDHGFLGAALTAWACHYSFRFKPIHIWVMIL